MLMDLFLIPRSYVSRARTYTCYNAYTKFTYACHNAYTKFKYGTTSHSEARLNYDSALRNTFCLNDCSGQLQIGVVAGRAAPCLFANALAAADALRVLFVNSPWTCRIPALLMLMLLVRGAGGVMSELNASMSS